MNWHDQRIWRFCRLPDLGQKLRLLLGSVTQGIPYEIKPGITDEKGGNAALLISNSGFYFIFDPQRFEGRD